MPGLPERILSGDVHVLTQGSGPASINDSLVQNLTGQLWADVVSPEILSLGTLDGAPVLIRGADPTAFLEIERAEIVFGAPAADDWALAGEGLVRRLGLDLGAAVSLVGYSIPRLDVVQLRGIYRADTPANDELIVDFAEARFLTGVGPTSYHSIRVKTEDPDALVRFLEVLGSSVHVAGPGGMRADVHSEPPADDRLANLILRTGLGGAPRDYLSEAIADATASVRVVAYGIAGLLSLLVALGIHGVQARAFADARRSIGLLRAVGASDAWVRRQAVRETLPRAVAAALVGGTLGAAVSIVLRPTAGLVVFGHSVVPEFGLGILAAIVGAIAGIAVVSSILLVNGALRAHPSESILEVPDAAAPVSLEVVLRG